MRAISIIIFFVVISGALATADVDEIAAMVNIRNHVPGLNTVWTDERLLKACSERLNFISCTAGHVSEIDFGSLVNSAPTGKLGNITGLRFLMTLALSSNQVLDLDAWYTQLPTLNTLTFIATRATPSLTFTANFTQNPQLSTFSYVDRYSSVLPWKITGAHGLKSLTIDAPSLGNFSSDFLVGLNLTYLSFAGVGSLKGLSLFPDYSHLTYLETLVLASTKIRQLSDFTNLVNLVDLDLQSCSSLTKIPPSVSSCVKLQSLNCYGCKLNQADSLPNLSSTRLNLLDLNGNSIQKVWPDGLCQLSTNPAAPGLRLRLSSNGISDPPACFARTTQLYSITLGQHNFTTFPSYLANMPSLVHLDAQCSRPMAGGFPDISRLPLFHLDLTNCGLVGKFPIMLPKNLTILYLNGNKLSGTINDNVFANSSSLRYLYLGQNTLSGPFPSSIGKTRLNGLLAQNNAFTSLPKSLGQLPLKFLDFSHNKLRSIPSDEVWANLTSLFLFHLNDNRDLSGPLPVFWSKRGSSVNYVLLNGCSFVGDVPSLNSTSLTAVILSDNSLDGIIRPSGYAREIDTFAVDRNRLTGSIPPSLGSQNGLYSANHVDFSNNQLTGSIPSTFQQLFDRGSLTEFIFNNNGIDGPLPNLARNTNLRIFKGDHTKVRLCDANPNIRAGARCTLTDVAFPGACGCESWYTACITTNITCPAPGYVAPLDPPGTSAPTPILPPRSIEPSPSSEPHIPPEVLAPFDEDRPVASVQVGSAASISTNFVLLGALVSVLGFILQ